MKLLSYVGFLLAGVVAGAAIVIAALKYYLDMSQPYVVLAVAFVALQLLATLVRKALGKPRQLRTAIFAVAIDAAAFAIGGVAAMHGLLAIYPPNFT